MSSKNTDEKKEGKIEMTGIRGNGRQQLFDDLKETRNYCKLKKDR